jgi:hypothetical protein
MEVAAGGKTSPYSLPPHTNTPLKYEHLYTMLPPTTTPDTVGWGGGGGGEVETLEFGMNENQRVHPTRLSGLAGGFRGNFLLLCGKITDWFGRFRRGKIGGAPTRLFVASGKGGEH